MKLVVAFVLGMASMVIWEGKSQTSLTASIGSYHFNRDKSYCEFNPGVGLSHRASETVSVVYGVYKNSSCDTSFYGGAIYEPWSLGSVRIGNLVAVASGYSDAGLTVIGAATAAVDISGLTYRLLFIPAASKGVLALFVEKRW